MKNLLSIAFFISIFSFAKAQDSISYYDFSNYTYEVKNQSESDVLTFLDTHYFNSMQKSNVYLLKKLVELNYFLAIEKAFGLGFKNDILDYPFEIKFSCGVGMRSKKNKSYNTCYEAESYQYLAKEKSIVSKQTKLANIGAVMKIYDVETAARYGYLESMKFLLSLSKDSTQEKQAIQSALKEASGNGFYDIVVYLVEERGANPTSASGSYTPMWMGLNYFSITKYFVSKGYEPTLILPGNSNMIQRAAWIGCPETVKLLLEYNPDVKLKNSRGDDAFSQCKKSKSEAKDEVLKLLKEYQKNSKKK